VVEIRSSLGFADLWVMGNSQGMNKECHVVCGVERHPVTTSATFSKRMSDHIAAPAGDLTPHTARRTAISNRTHGSDSDRPGYAHR
jgi:hypothetical protein